MSGEDVKAATDNLFTTFSFSQADFLKLPPRQQEFALVMAQIHNDLRHVVNLFRRESNGLNDFDARSPETAIVLHQYIHAIRILYGWTYEAWLKISEYWHGLTLRRYPRESGRRAEWVDDGNGLIRSLGSKISPDGKRAGDELKAYFTSENPVKNVRDKFSFHYDSGEIRSEFAKLGEDEVHQFVVGGQRTNVFYSFSERIRMSALVRSFGGEDPGRDAHRFFAEALRPWGFIQDFSHEAIFAILSQCGLQHQKYESSAITDPTKIRPVIFIDEAIARREAKNNSASVANKDH